MYTCTPTKPKGDYVKLLRATPARYVKKWVLVQNPGQYDQAEIAEFSDYGKACKMSAALAADENMDVDIMRRLDNGTLTTEY